LIPLLLLQVPPQLRVIEFHVPFVHPHPFLVAVDVVPAIVAQLMQLAIGPPTKLFEKLQSQVFVTGFQ
jgi:hypothetical protein